jgi:flagellar motor switch protein FliM
MKGAIMTERDNSPDTLQDGDAPDGTVQVYDFTSPKRLSGEQISRIEHLHGEAARRLSMSLAALLRRAVTVEVTSIEEVNYATFVGSIPSPGATFAFNADPLEGFGVLDIDPKVIFTLIDRMLGGKGEPIGELRELTAIERTVAGRVTKEMLQDLEHSWKSVGKIRMDLAGFANGGDLIKAYGANTSTIVVELRIESDNCQGTIRMGYPYPMFEPLLREAVREEATAGGKQPDSTMAQLIQVVPLEISARLHRSMVRMGELANLQAGDVLVLDSDVDEEVEILAQGKKVFEGRPGTNRNKLAIKISRVIKDGGSQDDS